MLHSIIRRGLLSSFDRSILTESKTRASRTDATPCPLILHLSSSSSSSAVPARSPVTPASCHPLTPKLNSLVVHFLYYRPPLPHALPPPHQSLARSLSSLPSPITDKPAAKLVTNTPTSYGDSRPPGRPGANTSYGKYVQ